MDATHKRKNTRRALVVALVGLFAWKLFFPIINQPLQAKRDAIARETRGLESLQSQLQLYTGYLQQVRATGTKCLPPDAMTATIRYQDWLRDCCEQVGIANPNITIKEPQIEEAVGARIQVALRTSATLESVGSLIDTISSAKFAHRIMKIRLQDWDSIGNTIGLILDMDALSLKENPTFDVGLFTKPIAPRGFGEFIGQRKSFSRYTPPSAIESIVTSEESEAVAVSTAPRSSRPDSLGSILLVGIVHRDGAPRALLRDNLKSVDLVCALNEELRIDDFVATVTGIDKDCMMLVQGENVFQISLGQTLRQGVAARDTQAIH